MNNDVANRLLALNREFYSKFADTFSESRLSPQPGYYDLLEHGPSQYINVLDVGCGNGRFGRFILERFPSIDYVGVDFTNELLVKASEHVSGSFLERDISQIGFLKGLGVFDVIVCLAALQHIPQRSSRLALLMELAEHLSENGQIFLANWQFLESPRQRRKIRGWDEVGLSRQALDANDYLLSWQRNGHGLRYVCFINAQETAELAADAGLRVKCHFRKDGKEENLNLYTILTK